MGYRYFTVGEVDYPIKDQPICEWVTTSGPLILLFSVCACVCLTNLRYSEREVISPRCLHHLEELRLMSCTNCRSSLNDVQFERKSLRKFFASYVPNSVHASLHFWLSWAGRILPTTTKPLEVFGRVGNEGHTLHIAGTIVAVAFYMNGL